MFRSPLPRFCFLCFLVLVVGLGSFSVRLGFSLGMEAGAADAVWTSCRRFGRSIAMVSTCPVGKQMYGGLCYKSCAYGYTRTAVCTCVKRTCSTQRVCDGKLWTDCWRFSSVARKSCPSGWRRTAVCTCQQCVSRTYCSSRPWTNCSRFGGATSPITDCPAGYEQYGGRCYRPCPSGYSRTAVCTCAKKGWELVVVRRIKRKSKHIIQITGPVFEKQMKELRRFAAQGARNLIRQIDAQSARLAKTFLADIDRKLRQKIHEGLQRVVAKARAQQTSNLRRLRFLASQTGSRQKLLALMQSQTRYFRSKYNVQSMKGMARSGALKAKIKDSALKALKSTASSLLTEAFFTMATVPVWAATECLFQNNAGTYRYKRCFEETALRGTKFAIFDLIFSAVYTPLEIQVVVPAAIQLSAAVTALVAAATGGVGAVAAGIIIGVSAKIAITIVLMEEFQKLFPYYEKYIWVTNPAMQRSYRNFFASFVPKFKIVGIERFVRDVGVPSGGSSHSGGSVAALAGRGLPVYGIDAKGDLYWYKHFGARLGTFKWSEIHKVGSGWGGFRRVLGVPGGIIYAIKRNGDLLWFKHHGASNGRVSWSGPRKVGNGWGGFQRVFAAPGGIIYAIKHNGDLLWFKHLGYSSGRVRWLGPRKVGSGWGGFRHVLAAPGGIIYAIKRNGDLIWFKHRGVSNGRVSWSGPRRVGVGWGGSRYLFVGPNNTLYKVNRNTNLYWYRHLGAYNGTFRWSGPRLVGKGWDGFGQIFTLQQTL